MPRAGKQRQLPDGKLYNDSTCIYVKTITHKLTGFTELLQIDGNDGSIIRCLPCSQHLGTEQYLRRSGLTGHQKVKKHKQAVLSMVSGAQ